MMAAIVLTTTDAEQVLETDVVEDVAESLRRSLSSDSDSDWDSDDKR